MDDMSEPWTRSTSTSGPSFEEDDALAGANAAAAAAGLPAIQVPATQGKLLQPARARDRRDAVLEVGTLGGYSAIWLARALPEDGELLSLELEERHAAVARANLERAGVAACARACAWATRAPRSPRWWQRRRALRPRLHRRRQAEQPGLLRGRRGAARRRGPHRRRQRRALRRGGRRRPRATPRSSGCASWSTPRPSTDRVEGTAIQTVGVKGYDGFALFRVV